MTRIESRMVLGIFGSKIKIERKTLVEYFFEILLKLFLLSWIFCFCSFEVLSSPVVQVRYLSYIHELQFSATNSPYVFPAGSDRTYELHQRYHHTEKRKNSSLISVPCSLISVTIPLSNFFPDTVSSMIEYAVEIEVSKASFPGEISFMYHLRTNSMEFSLKSGEKSGL